MKLAFKILLIIMIVTSFSTASYAQKAEYKKLSQRMALLYKKGRNLEAIEVAKEIITVAEETFGEKHAYVASSLSNLAMLDFNEGLYNDAKSNYEKALLINEELLGKDHSQHVKLLGNIKECCVKLGETDNAKIIDERIASLQ